MIWIIAILIYVFFLSLVMLFFNAIGGISKQEEEMYRSLTKTISMEESND